MGRFNLEEYEPVEDRIRAFYEEHPDGRILTDLVGNTGQQFIVKAAVYVDRDDTVPWATGHAEETVGSSPVNKTSALENAETSAIGRALANAGYAAKGKRPSREEMVKATRAQPWTDELHARALGAIGNANMAALDQIGQSLGRYDIGETHRVALLAAMLDRREALDGPQEAATGSNGSGVRVH